MISKLHIVVLIIILFHKNPELLFPSRPFFTYKKIKIQQKDRQPGVLQQGRRYYYTVAWQLQRWHDQEADGDMQHLLSSSSHSVLAFHCSEMENQFNLIRSPFDVNEIHFVDIPIGYC